MSVEAYVLAKLVEQGSLKPAFQEGIDEDDFQMYEDEWAWLCDQAQRRHPINPRLFKKAFPDFEWVVPNENLPDLIDELKRETAYYSLNGGIESVLQELKPENAMEQAEKLREILGDVLRLHGHQSDVLLTGNWKDHIEEIRRIRQMREAGESMGISTGIRSLDHHWGGLVAGRVYVFLGRPGDAKSFTLAKVGMVHPFLEGRRVGVFSPEMDEYAHNCRIATLLSADKRIREECGLKYAFRNRALMDGMGFDVKAYKRFRQFLDNMPGAIHLFTQKYRRSKMSPAFLESKVDDLGLEILVVDPIYKLKASRRRQLKHEEIADLVDQVTDIAKMFNIPVLISNQAGRALVGGKGEAPGKDSSHGSDAPSQEGDAVVGVRYYTGEHNLRLRCDKNRHGESFVANCKAYLNIGVIEDTSEIKDNYSNDEPEDENDRESSQDGS